MHNPPRAERTTQNRVARLFTDPLRADCLGYDNLGNWSKREGNRNIEPAYLSANLKQRGYTDAQVSAALRQLQVSAEIRGNTLYDANFRTYGLLRYGADVQTALGEQTRKVHFIDWANPDNNDFALAEEVTLRGGFERRPDMVLYINGIAIAVIAVLGLAWIGWFLHEPLPNAVNVGGRDATRANILWRTFPGVIPGEPLQRT